MKKTGIIKNIIDQSFIDYMLEHYERLPKTDNGLRHSADTLIEQDFNQRFKEKVSDVVKEGDIVKVKVLDIDSRGKVKLSMKAVEPE